jgi:IS605 OrfB family transposase
MIKTRKIKLIAIDENKKEIYSYLRSLASELSEIGNQTIRYHINNQFDIKNYTNTSNISKSDATKIVEEKLKTSIRNYGYQKMSHLTHIGSNIRTNFNSEIYKKIQTNFFDIATNKISIPSFRKNNIAIPFDFDKKKPFNLNYNNNYYYFNFPLSRTDNRKMDLYLYLGKDRSNNKIIIDRIIKGEYNVCASSILIKDNDFYLLLTYKQPEIIVDINPDKSMGIDLGINRAVSFYITGETYQPKQLSISEKIQHERIKIVKERNSLQSGIKYSKGGHGIKRKIQALENFKEKEKNWYKNINHKISKEIIDIALYYKVGVIKMEDLTGITKNSNEYFLKSWSYYQLQSNIEYKAKMYNIQVVWVDPKNTSRTCPICGLVNEDNRSKDDVRKFSCKNTICDDYNKIKDADIVAAINIAEKNGKSTKGNNKEARIEKYKEKQKEKKLQ